MGELAEVSRGHSIPISGRRAKQQRFWKLERFEGNTKKADNFMWT